MRSKHLFLDLLDLEADFLGVGRVNQEALNGLPGLKREHINLVYPCAERIDESTEEVTSVELDLTRLPYLCDLIKGADTDLSKGLVYLL